MELLELVLRRQSCRAYSNRPVPRTLIDKCIETARLAPSACNSQPWTFLVIDKDPLRSKAAKAMTGGVYNLNKFVHTAPVLIAVLTEKSKYAARLGGLLRNVQYNLIDIGIAGQHFDLQAAELGLGCCWLGWFNEKALRRALDLPRGVKIDIVFTLGYPADENIRPKNRKSLENIRRYLS